MLTAHIGIATFEVQGAPLSVAQAAPQSGASQSRAHSAPTHATERARDQVLAATRVRDRIAADKAALAREYEAELAELDRLKKRRASWRRDRLIRDHMSRSHSTAKKLAAIDARLRGHQAQLRRARRALLAAIERELAAGPGPGPARRAALERWHRHASQGLQRGANKIILPDADIDLLADPEELDDQAALIRQSEAQLARELERLDKQSRRYERMAALQKTQRRAVRMGRFDDDRPRRSAGRANGERAAVGGDASEADQPNAEPATPGAPPAEPGDSGRDPPNPDSDNFGSEDPMFDVVLAEVVDATTIDALRAAGASSDPAVKARAAQRALEQVKARLERLRRQRQDIQKRARSLRR